MNNSGQIHMLEVVAFIIIISITLFSVQQLSNVSVPTTHSLSELKNKADNVLLLLDSSSLDYPTGKLMDYVKKGLGGDDDSITSLKNEIDELISPFLVLYNIWVYEEIDNMNQVEAEEKTLLYPTDGNARVTPESTVRVHRVIVYDKHIYDVVLEIWHI